MSKTKIVVRSLAELGFAMRQAGVRDCAHERTRPYGSGERICDGCGRRFAWHEYADISPATFSTDGLRADLVPGGDLAPCPCGKRSYADEATAISQAAVLKGGAKVAYRCPLGLPVYHLRTAGRSRRQKFGR